jgi:signal transduction histidine kinase/CheY-like chemotaxis protein
VAVVADLTSVGPALATQLAGFGGVRYLVVAPSSRRVLASSELPGRWVGRSLAGTGFYRDRAQAERPDLGGTLRLFASASAPGFPLRIYAGIGQTVALAGASTLFQRYLILILVAVALLIAATAVIERRIVRPVRVLERAMVGRRLDGEAALPQPRGPAELVSLTNAFAELVAAAASELQLREAAEAERERLQRSLAQTHRLESLGQLAGGIAHDFNNLLGVIIGYADFVSGQLAAADHATPPDLDALRNDVEQIERAAERATGLTRQLLAFARREVTRPEVVDLGDVVRETEQLLRRTLGEHVQLTCKLGERLPPVLADPGQLEQVLVNLAVNARDAMPTGGTLLIETAEVEVDQDFADARPGLTPGPYVRLRVSDTGEGMEPAVLEHAFEPFFTTKPEGLGTGLGLATIYGIITQLGGYVSLYSESGIGTTCSVMLPATSEDATASSAPDRGAERYGHGETILLVEDEDGIREVARRILERRGYKVHSAAGGAEALALADALDEPLDLLLTDAVMPEMLGRTLADQISTRWPDTRVLYMSGYAAPMLGLGTSVPPNMHLIEKPFTERALLAKVQEALTSAVDSGPG